MTARHLEDTITMNRLNLSTAGAIVAGFALLTCTAIGAFADAATGTTATTPPQPPMHAHNSNTWHKIGKAIQYTTRKDTENLSVDTHRTVHEKSVVRNRRTGNNFAMKPNGHVILKSSTNPAMHGAYAHRRWYRRHHHYRHPWVKK